jgi:hypothetical protein
MATDKTFIVSGFVPATAASWAEDADRFIKIKADIEELEAKAETLKAVLLANPAAEEYLNERLGKKLAYFPESPTTSIDPAIASKLTKAEIEQVATFSEKKLMDLGKAPLVAEFTVQGKTKSAFFKVADLARADIAKIATLKAAK